MTTTTTTTDPVATFLSNARGAEYGFANAALYALEQFNEKNNKPLYALIAFCNGKKFGTYKIEAGYSLAQFSTPLKRILARALVNTSFVFKDGKAGVKPTVKGETMGVNGGVLNALQELIEMYNGALGVKSDAFQSMFPAVKKEITPNSKDGAASKEKAAKDAERVAKAAKDQGHDQLVYLMALQAELTKEIAALQAAQTVPLAAVA
jgi:hypothetical protein